MSENNLGTLSASVSLDTAQFTQSIQNLNRQMKVIKSEFDAASDGTRGFGKSIEGLKEKEKMLTKQMEVQGRKTNELKRRYEELKRTKGEDTKETQEALIAYNKSIAAMKRTEQQLGHVSSALKEQQSKIKKTQKVLNDFAEKSKGIGTKLSTTLTPAIAGIGLAFIKVADDATKSTSKIQRTLGITKGEAEKLNKVARDLWREGFGEGMEEVETGLLSVKQNIKGLDDGELETVTKNAMYLAQTFDSDVNEVTRAGQNIIKGFGSNSKEAFDLMAWGAQNGLNFSNEMFDNLSEYAPLFGKMGFSAEEYFELLGKGSQSGIYNLDYINDAMKEFQIRAKDGSKSTTEAMGQLSDSTQKVWKQFLNGKGTVKDVHNAVIKDLKGMDDQTEANNIGVSLYGTKWEDLESDAMYSMGNITGELKNVDGAMQRSGDAVEKSFGERAKIAWRKAQDALLPLAEVLLQIASDALPKVTEGIKWFSDKLDGMSPAMKKAVIIGGGLVAILAPMAVAVGSVVGAVSTAIGAFGGVAGAMGIAGGATGGIAAALAALTGPVGIAVGALALVAGGAYAIDKAMDKPIMKSDIFKGAVSESTKDILGNYEKLKSESEVKLNLMAGKNEDITQKHVNNMVGMYDKMTQTILTQMDTKYNAEKEKMVKQFAENDGLTKEEEAKILTDMDKHHNQEREKVQKNGEKKNKIIQDSFDKNGKITEEATQKINAIEVENQGIMVKNTAETKDELVTIMRNLKNQSGTISAETAAKTVKESKKARDKVVINANKQQEDSIKAIKYQRDVTGEISKDQADKMIKDAIKQRDNVVKKADSQHKGVVKAAKKQAKEHAHEVDWETGEVKNGWDKMQDQVDKAVDWLNGLFGGSSKKSNKSTDAPTRKYSTDRTKKLPTRRANGTPNGKHNGGMALVGEEGVELAHIPNKGMAMLGVGGQHFMDLPKGSSVLPHRHTKKVMKQYGIPMYANGVGDYFDDILDGAGAVWDKATSKFGVSDSLIPSWANKITGSPMAYIGDMAKGFIDKKISSFFESMSGDGMDVFGAPFVMSSGYGMRSGGFHRGVDFAAPLNTLIRSMTSGVVRQAGWGSTGSGYGNYGNVVSIMSGAYEYLYAHMNKVLAKKGQHVNAGDVIGTVGSTGQSSGNHLHLEARKNGQLGNTVDPLTLIGGGGGTAKGAKQWTGVATKALMMTNQFSPSNLQKLLMQMSTESRGNPRAINLWDSNAKKGIPSKGLMQVIDPTFKRYALKGLNKDIYDPLSNIVASIRYAVSTYGSLGRAYRGVGYESGGFINKEHMAKVGEGNKREVVIPLEQYPSRAKSLWLQAGRELGMLQMPNLNSNSGAGISGGGTTNAKYDVRNTYNISVAANINDDRDVKDLAYQIKMEIEREQKMEARSAGLGFA